MTQQVFDPIDPNTESGVQLATDLNNFRDSLLSMHSGTTRPTYVKEGTVWLNNADPNNLKVYLYINGVDKLLYTYNTTTGVLTPPSNFLTTENRPAATSAEMQAGTETALRSVSPKLVADGIHAITDQLDSAKVDKLSSATPGFIPTLDSTGNIGGEVDPTYFQPADQDIPTIAATTAEMQAGTETALRSMSPKNVADAVSALAPPAGGGLLSIKTFTASGTYTKNTSAKGVRVIVVGGGGGGSVRYSDGGTGRGGSAGGAAIKWIDSTALSSSVTVTVGVGSITTGGTSSFGAYCSATGGAYGGGTPGVGSGGDVNITGGKGGNITDGDSPGASIFGTGGTTQTNGAFGGGGHATTSGFGGTTATYGANGVVIVEEYA